MVKQPFQRLLHGVLGSFYYKRAGGLVVNHKLVKLDAGLYLVATPLGSSRDITLRALDILASADILAAEDTRNTRKLLDIHGISLGKRQISAYHEHSAASRRSQFLSHIADGHSVAYVSDAGTPLIADPGYQLVKAARLAKLAVFSVPGPAACIAALSVAGLPTDQFHFVGFLPSQPAGRQKHLKGLMLLSATVVIYESPKRLNGLLADIMTIGGSSRQVAVCRELTKRFEDVQIGQVKELIDFYERKPAKGEIVVLVAADKEVKVDELKIKNALRSAMQTLRVKDAADTVAGAYGQPRRDIYQIALQIQYEEQTNQKDLKNKR
jgi:16S rRNA (cytidine1402-2'-O)-methyltransferase